MDSQFYVIFSLYCWHSKYTTIEYISYDQLQVSSIGLCCYKGENLTYVMCHSVLSVA